jgi:hypothetical protein
MVIVFQSERETALEGKDMSERKTVLETWLEMCCTTPEFVKNYNRLNGTSITFTLKPRSNIEALVDKACEVPQGFGNDPEQEREFFAWCTNTLMRLPMLSDPKYFEPSPTADAKE